MGKQRTDLSLERKIYAIRQTELGKSSRNLARELGVGKTQISNIIKRKAEYLAIYNSDGPSARCRKIRKTGNEELNRLMHEWYRIATSMNLPLSGPIIQAKALVYAGQLGIATFTASNGWLDSFRKRHQIFAGVSSSGESANVKVDTSVKGWRSRLPGICHGYRPEDIWNLDETSLYFKALPDDCLALTLRSEQCGDGKLAVERLTLAVCCSMTGEKEKPILIGHSGKTNHPTCFENLSVHELPVTWLSNKRAWMTVPTFEEWMRDLDRSMERQKRKIILFLDDETCHPNVPLGNIKLQFFPLNATSKIQPLGQGIFRAVKSHFRNTLLHYVVSLKQGMANPVTDHQITHQITALDAVYWIEKAWNQTSPAIIQKSFRASGFENIGNAVAVKDIASPTDDVDQEGETLITRFSMGQAGERLEWSDFVTFDDDVATSDMATGDWEQRLVDDWVGTTSPESVAMVAETAREEDEAENTADATPRIHLDIDVNQLLLSLNQCRTYALQSGDTYMMGLVMDLRTHLSRVACQSRSRTGPEILAEFFAKRDHKYSNVFQEF